MRKWTKRLSASGLTLFGIVIVLALIGWRLVRGTPEWYQPQALSAEERDAAAQRATDKLVTVQNEAARARADEGAARNHPSSQADTARPANAITISFTDDEINALIEKWSVWQSFKASYERYMTDPYIVFKDGRIILAGRLRELNAVASLHFDPQIDANGRLKIKLVRILAGKLPLPEAIFTKYQRRASDGLQARMPAWRQQAAIDSTGIANSSAISAAMGELLINALQQQPAEPVLFLRLFERGSIPVRLSEVKIENHTIAMVVYPMTPSERTRLLQQIHDASPVASAGK